MRAHGVDLRQDRIPRAMFLPRRARRGPECCRSDRRRTRRPKIRFRPSTPVRLAAATNTPLAIAWLRIIVSQAACWLAPNSCLFRVQPADGRRIEQNLRTGQGRQPGRFGIPLVPADQRADRAEPRRHALKAEIARREIKFLVIVSGRRECASCDTCRHATRRHRTRRPCCDTSPAARRSNSEPTITTPCCFAAAARASLVGPGIGSASANRRWSSLWQGYCPANSSCRQTIFAPAAAASAIRASAFSTIRLFRSHAAHLHQCDGDAVGS